MTERATRPPLLRRQAKRALLTGFMDSMEPRRPVRLAAWASWAYYYQLMIVIRHERCKWIDKLCAR